MTAAALDFVLDRQMPHDYDAERAVLGSILISAKAIARVTSEGLTAEDFFSYMKDTFDMLYREGESEPRMMSLALHDRLIGRPGRAEGLARFLDYVREHDRVWICRGVDIARHWIAHHPAPEIR